LKSATLNELKRALADAGEDRLVEIAVRMARYKNENKELLTYLLFEADDEAAYVAGVRQEIAEAFAAIPNTNLYYFKKSVRKILRIVNKHARYSGLAQTELELRLEFCRCLMNSGVDYRKSPVIANLFDHQVKKIDALIRALPEDLRLDFQRDYSMLRKSG